MPKYGVKVSQSNQDVVTAADKDLQFSSEYTSFKIKRSSLNGGAPAVTINLHGEFDPPNATTVNIVHGLSYQPSFLIWCQDEHGNWHFQNSMSYGFEIGGASTDVHAVYCNTDLYNLNINIINLSTTNNYTVGYHYVIMHDLT